MNTCYVNMVIHAYLLRLYLLREYLFREYLLRVYLLREYVKEALSFFFIVKIIIVLVKSFEIGRGDYRKVLLKRPPE